MTETTTAQQFWDTFYDDRDSAAGKPNALLVREVASLTPGTALDLGCAEGADALWLAELGWQVTAADVSATALRRAETHAAAKGLTGRIDWQRHDLARSFPAGVFDLVSAQFLHSPVAASGERENILARAAKAVAPGGLLLVVGHAGWPSWLREPPADVHLPTTAEVLGSLDLEPGRWQVELEELLERELTGPEGESGVRKDNVLRIRRAR
ncbi:class I SAM-dependent methyltransferase [Amycolatopsis sp. H20-H5]|uniref:class I SAM-dependent methyltransferase n=1 Tax=Amycolatopsis sp. H20-H5 TaxID=3046309 RepID=UPI002DBAFA36|nr:class I SAM-dependent methyltransferase [Amycolatopsis sp. H20-H5]MEC3981818.1 class I SAM-dependent methyltransferase [Amycolatopsis sp. H20-H5]